MRTRKGAARFAAGIAWIALAGVLLSGCFARSLPWYEKRPVDWSEYDWAMAEYYIERAQQRDN